MPETDYALDMMDDYGQTVRVMVSRIHPTKVFLESGINYVMVEVPGPTIITAPRIAHHRIFIKNTYLEYKEGTKARYVYDELMDQIKKHGSPQARRFLALKDPRSEWFMGWLIAKDDTGRDTLTDVSSDDYPERPLESARLFFMSKMASFRHTR